jgi:hypothetical protein
MAEWQKKRNPDDVPTPIAVAVSDFCRRAKARASATEVREALSFLSEDDDFRIKDLTEREPEATPLGPFAVVDLVSGTAAPLAVQRQGCGYYELVRQLAKEREERPPAAPVEAVPQPRPAPASMLDEEIRDRTPSSPAPTATSAKAAKAEKGGKAAKPTVQERIAPKKRGPVAEVEEETDEVPESQGPTKRQLPQPRGRFTRLAATKQPIEELSAAESRDYLVSLIEQYPHRLSLLKALGEQYSARAGAALSFGDVEPVLERHNLTETLTKKERELVLASYTEHKGAHSRVAWALGVSPAELTKLAQSLGITQGITELRERYKREALSPQNLTYRLDLLGRTKYLSDLGIQKRFIESLTKDLRTMLQGAVRGASDLGALADAVGRKFGAPAELVTRAMDRLGLTDEFRKRLGNEPATHPQQ